MRSSGDQPFKLAFPYFLSCVSFRCSSLAFPLWPSDKWAEIAAHPVKFIKDITRFSSPLAAVLWNSSWGKSAKETCHAATLNMSVMIAPLCLPGCGICRLDITHTLSRSTMCHLRLSVTRSDSLILFLEWWHVQRGMSFHPLCPASSRQRLVVSQLGSTL